MLREEQPAQGPELGRGPEVDVLFAARVAEHQVGVYIHQARHDEVPAGVDDLVLRAWLRCVGRGTDVSESPLLDHQGPVAPQLVIQAREQALATHELT